MVDHCLMISETDDLSNNCTNTNANAMGTISRQQKQSGNMWRMGMEVQLIPEHGRYCACTGSTRNASVWGLPRVRQGYKIRLSTRKLQKSLYKYTFNKRLMNLKFFNKLDIHCSVINVGNCQLERDQDSKAEPWNYMTFKIARATEEILASWSTNLMCMPRN